MGGRGSRSSRPLILTVDDNEGIHEAYRLELEDHYDVVSALDGPQALEILCSHPVDAMLLDIRMPEMDGLLVLEHAKRIRPRLVVIVVSVIESLRTGMRAIRLGAVDYVTKPSDPDHLELAVRRALEDVPPASASSMPVRATPRVSIISADLGFRATLSVALWSQCRVNGAFSLGAAAVALSGAPSDLTIVDVRSLTESVPAAIASVRRWFPKGPLLVIAPLTAEAASRQTRASCVDVVLPGFVADSVFRGAAALLTTRPNLAKVQPPGPLVARVIEHAAERFPRLGVEETAQGVGVSASHFCRKFSAETALMTPKGFLDRVRIEAAKYLLRETPEKIDVIAERIGLCDAPHLSRTFRRHTGVTPGEYRQQQ